ncbi:hypothetical protein HYPSUDRAFT_683762 [Hypholoma sublateritium FD-334 SS-4]|uniref:Phospholipid/glycerol acyltransferase domain-containing protein n=1 Tax=Hypholoma sublateritium (strain FD-334 SS-4) TaxID=945553 RepID=A0A0D2ME38_HYPSF|nr:hypothetical protein HYPSUDRAFT_683762 [Hypholoma sublateritium FD-334 SS-4]
MELKLVYRALRKISDWTVTGYYSEIDVQGVENVPEDGPLIIASTHHNEIIDIATLAMTIPQRRHLSFWAKSTMFANPLAGAILSSSGAIPVKRNPNGSSPPAPPTQDPSSSTCVPRAPPGIDEGATRAMLFRDTSRALAARQVVGVFPEGTSYTQAAIMQMLPGAAWAAVEYVRYVHEQEVDRQREDVGKGKGKAVEAEIETGLRIIPVAVVYTDKSRYLSRVSVKYGAPIFIDSYAAELFNGDRNESSRAVVKKIMAQVETQMRDMTVNALGWDTICAVSMARSILWDDEDKIPLKDWVEISQRLVRVFDAPEEPSQHLKSTLTKYYALLHYAHIRHSVLLELLPLSAASVLDVPPPHSVPGVSLLVLPTLTLLKRLPLSLFQFVLFAPPLLLHLPGYITGPLAKRCFALPEEEEAAAQFKAIGGGLGIGANVALALGILWKRNRIGTLMGLSEDDNVVQRALGLAGSMYLGIVLLVRWHRLLIRGTPTHGKPFFLLKPSPATYSQLPNSTAAVDVLQTFLCAGVSPRIG